MIGGAFPGRADARANPAAGLRLHQHANPPDVRPVGGIVPSSLLTMAPESGCVWPYLQTHCRC